MESERKCAVPPRAQAPRLQHRRGSALVLALVMMLLICSLTASLIAVAGARASAVARDARRVQGLALAESAVAAARAQLSTGVMVEGVSGALSTGFYEARVNRRQDGAVVTAFGRPKPLMGRPVTVRVRVTLAGSGSHWRVTEWQEVAP